MDMHARPDSPDAPAVESAPDVAGFIGLVRIAAAVAVAPIETVRRVMREVVHVVDPAHVDELLLQSYLFVGFPRTLNAMVAWREVSGVAAPERDEAAEVSHADEWPRMGETTCRAVYGPTYDALRRHVARLHPAIDQWMVVDGYGKVLSRPGLALAARECCIVAVCAATAQLPQLGSHLRGARRTGVSFEELAATLDAISDIAPADAIETARNELARLATAHGAP
jgi:4-carboxymuconolactone decarboxylase